MTEPKRYGSSKVSLDACLEGHFGSEAEDLALEVQRLTAENEDLRSLASMRVAAPTQPAPSATVELEPGQLAFEAYWRQDGTGFHWTNQGPLLRANWAAVESACRSAAWKEWERDESALVAGALDEQARLEGEHRKAERERDELLARLKRSHAAEPERIEDNAELHRKLEASERNSAAEIMNQIAMSLPTDPAMAMLTLEQEAKPKARSVPDDDPTRGLRAELVPRIEVLESEMFRLLSRSEEPDSEKT